MRLTLFHDKPDSTAAAARFVEEGVLARLRRVDERARREGLAALRPDEDLLVRLGMELDERGRVTKNSLGQFHLSWLAEQHPEWPARLALEAQELRDSIRQAHGKPLRYLIWAGMGGSAEDKAMFQAAGLLRRGPRLYVLDSTDPVKLDAILADLRRRSGRSLAQILPSTLVVGMALGMTSYEPVVNLRRLASLFDEHGIDSRPNFLYLTMTGSLLDRFARERGYRRVPLQLDEGNSTAGRHSSPLTRGSLLPLSLARVDMKAWLHATQLDEEELQAAWRLAAFLHTQARAGRDKVTLLPTRSLAGVSLWTKQNFEESLGKSGEFGLKIVIGEPVRLANYRSPKEHEQDRAFLVLRVRGEEHRDDAKITVLRRAGYPIASLTLLQGPLSRYLQFIHYAVLGVAYLEEMNFVTQPSVELYKAITGRLQEEAERVGGLEATEAWRAYENTTCRAEWQGRVTLRFDRLAVRPEDTGLPAPRLYAQILRTLVASRGVEYAELTFFGDLRYDPSGRTLGKVLHRTAEGTFRRVLRMPVDVYEGPAMNHSYHEMVIGHGRCVSTVLLAERPPALTESRFPADYHRAQFLATQMALADRGRAVVSLTVRDLEPESLRALDDFFRAVAMALKGTDAKRQ